MSDRIRAAEADDDAPMTLDELWAAVEAAAAKRAEDMPDERAALEALQRAYTRLTELGWRDAIYCPKDGTRFEVIEAGSTGVFPCRYQGTWPKGTWWADYGGDLWPSRPILFRLMKEPADD